MAGLSIDLIIIHGLILSIGLSFIFLGSMYLNPRLLLRDYPDEIQSQVPPQTNAEKRQRIMLGIPVYGFILAVLLYSNGQLVVRMGKADFLPIFLNTYLVFEIFNLFDLLVLDYLVTMVLKPRFLFIEGIEHLQHFNTFRHHFRGFLIGLVIGLILSLIITLISMVVL